MHKIINPDGWAPAKGYADGVLANGAMLFIGGQIGWTAQHTFVSHDFVGQTEQALRNICDVLAAAGGKPEHIVRLTWYVIDKKDYLARQRELGEAYRRVMGKHFPAMAMLVVSGLIEDEALVEIEATAVLPQSA